MNFTLYLHHPSEENQVLGVGLVLCILMLKSEPQDLITTQTWEFSRTPTFTDLRCVNLAPQCKAIG